MKKPDEVQRKSRRRLGILKEMMSEEELNALTEAVERPLSPADQAALEGGLTDDLGIAKPQALKD
ncbi:MAG: hypothetical protein OXU42_11400 [Deltaproteobacteria bacterium]|nr:hypothetical protein [Deltaproteobacteria bacterium]